MGAAFLLPLPLAVASPGATFLAQAPGPVWGDPAAITFGISSLGYGPSPLGRVPGTADAEQEDAAQSSRSEAERGPKTTKRKAVIRSTAAERVQMISANTSYDVPLAALQSYQHAASYVSSTDPGCQLSWGIVAAIGHVESSHGRFGGSAVLANGKTVPSIVGLPLNGAGAVAAIRDTDNGRLDGDKVWDRAVGPMQFIPSTWAGMGVDGDGDGVRDPNDFDDAALATALYLCSGYVDMTVLSSARAAIMRYNQSEEYVDLVLTIANAYDSGIVDVVANDDRPPRHRDRDRDRDRDRNADRDRNRDRNASRDGDRDGTRDGGSRDPQPAPDGDGGTKPPSNPDDGGGSTPPPPEEEEPPPPPPPPPAERTGTLRGSGANWTVGSFPLVFPVSVDPASCYGNFDPDPELHESLQVELGGLKGGTVTVSLTYPKGSDGVVTHINGIPFAAAECSPPEPEPTEPTPTTAPSVDSAAKDVQASSTTVPTATTESF
ncbi:MAG: lytic murein transglycosylase [Nocardioidaceae bacterium]